MGEKDYQGVEHFEKHRKLNDGNGWRKECIISTVEKPLLNLEFEREKPRAEKKYRRKYGDPDFYNSSADQYLMDWFDHLKRRQMGVLTGDRKLSYIDVEPYTVELIFYVCEELKQPPDSRFLSVELYSRYQNIHIKEAIKAAKRTTSSTEVWNKAKNQICQLSLLRIISCIQLASKFTMNSKIVSAKIAESALLKFNQPHSRKNILLSESRVFKCLNYRVGDQTLLSYLDILIHLCLPHIEQRLYDMCIRIMDIVYIRNKDISDEIAYRITEYPTKEYITAYNGCDHFLMSSAIIVTAMSICYPENDNLIDFAVNQLSKYTNKSEEQISLLFSVTKIIIEK